MLVVIAMVLGLSIKLHSSIWTTSIALLKINSALLSRFQLKNGNEIMTKLSFVEVIEEGWTQWSLREHDQTQP